MIGRHRIAELRRHAADAVSTRRTVHRPVMRGGGPRPSAFRAFGHGSWLVPPVHIDGAAGVDVGSEVIVLEHLSIEVAPGARLTVGDGTRLGRFVTISCCSSVHIGRGVSSSDGATVTDSWGLPDRARVVPPPPGAPVVIGDGAYLGAGSVVGPGVHIGAGSFVGEGAVVLDDIPAHSVVYGNPAVVVRHLGPDGGWVGRRFP